MPKLSRWKAQHAQCQQAVDNVKADLTAEIERLNGEVARVTYAARVAAGALLLVRSADSLAEKDAVAFDAVNAFMNLSGFERGTLTPAEARAALTNIAVE